MKSRSVFAAAVLLTLLVSLTVAGCGGGNARDQDGYFLAPIASPTPTAATGPEKE
jgi:hypothetical protein